MFSKKFVRLLPRGRKYHKNQDAMNERTKRLCFSLVGASTEFSFKKKMSCATSIDQNIQSAKRKITNAVTMALDAGGRLCVMLLAELTYFYRSEPYYMAVRSSIEMRRYRPAVLDYMQFGVQERADRLKRVLSEPSREDKFRDLKIETLRYFLSTYPSRSGEFKKFLTREEFMLVA